MITPLLAAYLELERQMLALDALNDPAADILRDAMDPLWYGLSDKERALLHNRTVLFSAGSFLTIEENFFGEAFEQPSPTQRFDPIPVADWECPAA